MKGFPDTGWEEETESIHSLGTYCVSGWCWWGRQVGLSRIPRSGSEGERDGWLQHHLNGSTEEERHDQAKLAKSQGSSLFLFTPPAAPPLHSRTDKYQHKDSHRRETEQRSRV